MSNKKSWIFIDQRCWYHLVHRWDTSYVLKNISLLTPEPVSVFQSIIASSNPLPLICYSSGLFLCLYFYCLSLHSLSLVIVCPVGFWMGSIWKNVSVFVLRLSSKSGTFGDLSTWPPYVAPQYHQHYSVMGKIGLAKNLLHDLICICFAKYEKM